MTMMKADGFDNCVIGTVTVCGQPTRILYDATKVIEKLMTDGIGTYEEALEFFEFNITGAYVGEGTPAYAYPATIEEIEDQNSEG
tara:strand:+ start:4535 stop:4789 length:255 start_codon:yes stop_codon:yes gene_type:complete